MMLGFNLKYFGGFVPESPDSTDEPKPLDAGGDELPFNHIADRRFEVLTYRLKKKALPQKRVSLMTGVGERGRDVVVYSDDGRLEQIVQCKLYADRLTLPETCRELLKLALHAFLDPHGLPEGVTRYEMWCPGDFSGPAAALLDTWPQQWNTEKLPEWFEELREKYKTFAALAWKDVETWVKAQFPKRLSIKKLNGVDITELVRASPEIYSQFFEGKFVLSGEELKSFMEDRFKAANFRQVEAEDERHILGRIQSFDPKLRLYFGAYVMGIHPAVLAAMNRGEFEKFVEVIGSAYDLIPVLTPVLMRLVSERTVKADKDIKHSSPAFAFLLGQLAAVKGGLRTEFHVMAKMDPFIADTDVSEFRGKTDEQIVSRLAERLWDSAPQPIPDGLKGEALATAHTMKMVVSLWQKPYGHDRARFIADVLQDFSDNASAVYAFLKEYLLLVPTQIMTLTDTMLPYEDDKMFNQFYETLHKMKGHL